VGLQHVLEDYLKREGLSRLFPTDRQETRSGITAPTMLVWSLGLWVPAIIISGTAKGWRGVAVGLAVPPLSLLIVLVLFAIPYVLRGVKTGEKADPDADRLGTVLLLVLPAAVCLGVALYTRSWAAIAYYAGTHLLVMLVLLLLQSQAYRVHLLLQGLRSVLRASVRSLSLLVVLMPVLLVVVVLSVFSQELWQAIGTLSWPRLGGLLACLVVPTAALVLKLREPVTSSLVGEMPAAPTITQTAAAVPAIADQRLRGLISEEEWTELHRQLEWRDTQKLAARVIPVVRRKVGRWLVLLLILSGLSVGAVFFLYFLLFLSIGLAPSTVAAWTGQELQVWPVRLHISTLTAQFRVPNTLVPVTKVAVLLGAFAGVASNVFALTDDDMKSIFTEWLAEKASAWIAVGCSYRCAITPDYQVWEYSQNDAKSGIANVSIVVPQGLSELAVRRACNHMEARCDSYSRLVIVTAFEQEAGRQMYRRGMSGNRWQLLHNKIKGLRTFEAIPLQLDELRYDHLLGRTSLEHGEPIPNDWFGDTSQQMQLGKTIWESDIQHEWVLHPFVGGSDHLLWLEIAMTKKMRTSDAYRNYVRELLKSARAQFPDTEHISIALCFRDTIDTLAQLDWSADYVNYRDDLSRRTTLEKAELWD
jgi:hypothetical protein